jgi:hypothetical protein
MRRIALLLALLLLSACYQVDSDTVSPSASVRVDGIRDGRYLRPDGVEVQVRWNAAEKLYDVVAKGAEPGKAGTARAARVAAGVYLVQYFDAARLSVLASVKGDDIVLLAPTKEAEKRLLKAHGLGIRPGPINVLVGSPGSVVNFFKDLAASGDFAESGRMTYIP